MQIYVKVHTPTGIFTGIAAHSIPTQEEAKDKLEAIQDLLRPGACDTLTIISDTIPGTDISFTQQTILNSVFEISIINDLPIP